jgi:putative lipase involved disintegration of autophagic bodies
MSPNFVQEQLSIAYVRAVIFRASFNLSRLVIDDHGIDGTIKSYTRGINRVDFQLKASYNYRLTDDHIAYDLDVHNYNVLAEAEGIPAVLILFAMPSDPTLWLDQSEQELQLRHCAYWLSLEDEQTSDNVRTKTVHIPRTNLFNVEGLPPMFNQLIPGWPGPPAR